MSKRIQFSIIIPLYNKQDVLGRTLDSVLAQKHESYEVIIVDDGSSDNSFKIAESYASQYPCIKVFRQSNFGPAKARNHGLTQAKNDYLLFLDADDEIMPDFLFTAAESFRQNTSQDFFASAHFRTVNGTRKSWVPYFENFGVRQGFRRIIPTDSPNSLLGMMWFLHSSTTVCKRSVVERFGGFYDKERSHYGEDSYLWLQVLLNCAGFFELSELGWYHTENSGLIAGRGSLL